MGVCLSVCLSVSLCVCVCMYVCIHASMNACWCICTWYVHTYTDIHTHIHTHTGLDVKGIDVVINFEVPRNLSEYVHRVGRTARAGRKGKAVTLADDSQRTKKMLKDIVRGAPDVIKRRVVPPDVVAATRARIETLEEQVDAIMEEEKVERELRRAGMEEEKTRNLIEHAEEIQARPKKSWFQTKDEKKSARQLNPASGRRLNAPAAAPEEEGGAAGGPAGTPTISRSKVFTGKKEDKYAGMSRKKRRRAEDREMDALEAAGEAALDSHAVRGHAMFAADAGGRAPVKGKVLSQKAAKAAYRRGELDLSKGKDKKDGKKRRRNDAGNASLGSKSSALNDAQFYKETLDKELKASRKPRTLKKNKKQAVATNKSFKSVKRMKRR